MLANALETRLRSVLRHHDRPLARCVSLVILVPGPILEMAPHSHSEIVLAPSANWCALRCARTCAACPLQQLQCTASIHADARVQQSCAVYVVFRRAPAQSSRSTVSERAYAPASIRLDTGRLSTTGRDVKSCHVSRSHGISPHPLAERPAANERYLHQHSPSWAVLTRLATPHAVTAG